jgi:hypothetical protein
MVKKFVNVHKKPSANIDSDSEAEEEIEYQDSSDEDVDPLSANPSPQKKEVVEVEPEPEIKATEISENETKDTVPDFEPRERAMAETHMIEEPEIVEEDNVGGFKNIPEEKAAMKPKQGPKKPKNKKPKEVVNQKTLDSLTEAVNTLLEQYQMKKSQVNDFEGKAKTREIRMPTELTNARNLSCKVTE